MFFFLFRPGARFPTRPFQRNWIISLNTPSTSLDHMLLELREVLTLSAPKQIECFLNLLQFKLGSPRSPCSLQLLSHGGFFPSFPLWHAALQSIMSCRYSFLYNLMIFQISDYFLTFTFTWHLDHGSSLLIVSTSSSASSHKSYNILSSHFLNTLIPLV